MKSPWPTKKLGEICEEIKKEKATIGITPYIEIGNVDVNSKKVIFNEKGAVKGSIFAPENSILISRVRPTRGAVTFIDKKIAVSSAFTIIKPRPEYNPKLLFYFLAWNKKFFEYLRERQKGTNYPSVREKDILEFEISFPENEGEQQKIVKILDTIQSAVEIQEKIIEKTKELKKSLMAELFKYGAPSFRKGRKLKKTETLNQSELGTGQVGEIPEDWEVVRLGDEKKGEPLILTLRNGLTYKQHELQESGIPITRIETIADGKIDFEKVGYLKNIDQNLLEEYKLKKGDILFSHINSEIHLGKTAIYLEDKFILHGMNLLLIRPNSKFIDSKFLNYLFNWYKDNGIFISIASRAVNQASINQNTLKNLKIPLPSLSEQQEIAEILQTIDQKIEIEKKKKELYEELFRTMLNKIMSQQIDINLLDY
jgi:restriction endonuclease S subunit